MSKVTANLAIETERWNVQKYAVRADFDFPVHADTIVGKTHVAMNSLTLQMWCLECDQVVETKHLPVDVDLRRSVQPLPDVRPATWRDALRQALRLRLLRTRGLRWTARRIHPEWTVRPRPRLWVVIRGTVTGTAEVVVQRKVDPTVMEEYGIDPKAIVGGYIDRVVIDPELTAEMMRGR